MRCDTSGRHNEKPCRFKSKTSCPVPSVALDKGSLAATEVISPLALKLQLLPVTLKAERDVDTPISRSRPGVYLACVRTLGSLTGAARRG